jgi:hypothetical protein
MGSQASQAEWIYLLMITYYNERWSEANMVTTFSISLFLNCFISQSHNCVFYNLMNVLEALDEDLSVLFASGILPDN